MIIVAGDVHGAIGALYERTRELQDKDGTRVDAIFQVGDLQIYSDASQVDKAVKKHGGVGEFPAWLREGRRAPIPTYAILGNHDDAKLFYEYAGREILPSLHLLGQGEVASIVLGGNMVRVGALGGNYSPRYFKIKPAELPIKLKGTSKNLVFHGCHPEPKAKDPEKSTGFFASLRMTCSRNRVFRDALKSMYGGMKSTVSNSIERG